MGKPPFKASDGGCFDIFCVIGGYHFGEFQFVKGRGALFRIKVRPESFPNGLPMSSLSDFLILG
jgi:hypothetical protein